MAETGATVQKIVEFMVLGPFMAFFFSLWLSFLISILSLPFKEHRECVLSVLSPITFSCLLGLSLLPLGISYGVSSGVLHAGMIGSVITLVGSLNSKLQKDKRFLWVAYFGLGLTAFTTLYLFSKLPLEKILKTAFGS